MRRVFLRLFRIFVIATLCVANALPGPAYALRPPQRESASSVEELTSQFTPQAGAEEVRVYLQGQVAGGKLTGAGKPIWRGKRPKKANLLKYASPKGAAHLMLENLPTSQYGGKAYFYWGGESYSTERLFDKKNPLLLWVKVGYPNGEVLGAWDRATGEPVYPSAGFIQIYSGGELRGNELIGAEEPIWRGTVVKKPFLWKEARLKGSAHLMLENVPTYLQDGKARFSWSHRTYPTERLFDPKKSLFLWVKVGYPGGEVIGAWDKATGEQVYPPEYFVQIYSGGELKGDKLIGAGESVGQARAGLKPRFWDDPRFEGSPHLMINNVTTHQIGDKTEFSWQGQYYYIGRLFDAENPLRLWLKVGYPDGELLGAWDMATGEQVYSSSQVMKIYRGGEIKGAKLTEIGEPIWQGQVPRKSAFWNDARLEGSSYLMLEGVPTYLETGRAYFSWQGRHHSTGRSFDAENPLRLWVKVSYPQGKVMEAWDMATGERVLSIAKVYSGGEVVRGKGLVGTGELVWEGKRPKKFLFWSDARLAGSSHLMLENVPTFSQNKAALFSWQNTAYYIGRFSKGKSPLRLWVKVSYPDGEVLGAWDMATREQVYPLPQKPADKRLGVLTELAEEGDQAGLEEKIAIYLDAEVVNGRLVGSPEPYRLFRSVPSAFFADPAVQRVGQVVFMNVPTHKDGSGLSRFSLAGRIYRTSRVYDPASPLSLIALVNPKTKRVTAAYDMSSGEKVYSEENLIRIYLSPALKDGRLEGDPLPDEVTARISAAFWKNPKVRKAKTVAFSDVVAFPRGKTAVFYLNKQPYWTSRPADPEKPLRLLVQANPRTRIPLAAYDMETGGQVYPVQELVWIYLDPPLEKGLLAGDAKPFRTVRSITADLWDLPEVGRSKAVAFSDVRAGSTYGWATFFIAQHTYQTDRRFDPSHPLKLLVLVDPRNRLPSAAYDRQTGEKIFPPAGRSIEVYLDPEIQDGKLQEDSLPVWRLKVFKLALLKKSKVQQADTLVIKDVPTFHTNGRAGFQVGKTTFYARFPLDPKRSEKLLVVINPKEPLPPRAAYLVSTGEQIYPALFPPVDLSADYVVSRIQLSADFMSGENFYRKRLSPAIGEALQGDSSLAQIMLSLRGEKLPLTLKKYPQGPVVWTLARDPGRPESPPEALIKAAQSFGFVRRSSQPADPRLSTLADLAEEEPTQAGAEENRIQAYLDPEMEDGKIRVTPAPFWTGKRIPPSFWKNVQVQSAKIVAVSNIATHPTGRDDGRLRFFIAKQEYRMKVPSAGKSPRLLVLVDPRGPEPMAAYDLETGEQLYSPPGLKRAYLNPVFKDGRWVGTAEPFWEGSRIRGDFWEQIEVRQSTAVLFERYDSVRMRERVGFHVAGKAYTTDKPFTSEDPAPLRVVVDPKTQLPTAAYDSDTGFQIYPPAGLIRIYVDPTLEEGRLSESPRPVWEGEQIQPNLWENPEVGNAKLIAIENYPTHSKTRRVVFHLSGQGYSTDLRHSGGNSPYLLLIVDPKSKTPLEAYHSETGEQVYPRRSLIKIFLDPQMDQGGIVGDPAPFWKGKVLSKEFWTQQRVLEARQVVVMNLGAFSGPRGQLSFSLSTLQPGKQFRTSKLHDPHAQVRLRVEVDPAEKLPIAAYDLKTGEQVYPLPQMPADPRLETLADLAEEDQAGMEEALSEVLARWSAVEGTDAVVVSGQLAVGPERDLIRLALERMPERMARRVYAAGNWPGLSNRWLKVIPSGAPEDVAFEVARQAPAPEKAWVIGSLGRVFGVLLKDFSIEVEELTPGQGLEEFLAQLGRALGVPLPEIEEGLERIRDAMPLRAEA